MLSRALSDAMLAAWLTSAGDVAKKLPLPAAGDALTPPPKPPALFAPAPDEPEPPVRYPLAEAAAADLLRKRVMTKAQFDALADDAKRTAFTVAQVGSLDALEKIQAALAEDAAKGGTLRTFGRRVDAILAGGSALSPAHIETVYRTNVGQAYRQGQQEILANPVVQDEFPYVEYVAVHDSRTRHEHLEMERRGIGGGPVYRSDDPTIRKFWPPWSYNCRCAAIPLTLADAARRGVAEAKKWLATGLPPPSPAWVAPPPFEPPAGFAGGAAPVRMSRDAEGHDHRGKGPDGGQFVSQGGGGEEDDDVDDNEDDLPELTGEQQKDLFTHGACGVLAQELLDALPGSEPVLWRNKDGTAYHAAVLYNGRLLHYGDLDEGYVPATREELDDAVKYDFDPRMPDEDARKYAKAMAQTIADKVGG